MSQDLVFTKNNYHPNLTSQIILKKMPNTSSKLKTLYEQGKEKHKLEMKISECTVCLTDFSLGSPSLKSSEYKGWGAEINNNLNKMNELNKKIIEINKIPRNYLEKIIFNLGYKKQK